MSGVFEWTENYCGSEYKSGILLKYVASYEMRERSAEVGGDYMHVGFAHGGRAEIPAEHVPAFLAALRSYWAKQ